jgi:hypothetical protein
MGKKHPFNGKKLKAVYATYGPLDLYNSGNFNPLTRNLVTGAILSRGHHCERCNAKMTQSCYEKFHYAFCSAWVEDRGDRERCGERFALHSDGCSKHRKVNGYNTPFYRAANGEDVDASEFDDPKLSKPAALEAQVNDSEVELALVDNAAEEYLKAHGELPATFHQEYYARLAKEKKNETAAKAKATPIEEKSSRKGRNTFTGGAGAREGRVKKSMTQPGTKYKKAKEVSQGIVAAGAAGAKESNEDRAKRLLKDVSNNNASTLR